MPGKKTLIIINPISGTGNKDRLEDRLSSHLSKELYEYEMVYTTGPTHATTLASEASKSMYSVVIAVGGDGTVNETAAGLIHTDTALGIIPVGSGNGLGRHLNIPTNARKAIETLNNAVKHKIDVCTANGIPFFNVAGVGYDARVAHEFAEKPTRGFGTYVQTVIQEYFKYSPKKFILTMPSGKIKKKALMVSFANGSQFGNNAYIAPNADLNDGLMDVSLLYRFPGIAAPTLAFQLFNKLIERSKYTETFQVPEITVKQKSRKIHLDGEPFKMEKKIHFKVLPSALNILVPKDYLND